MSLRIVESTSLPSSSADQQCIHGKAMSQRCDDCATHRLTELRASNLIRRLLEWSEYTGGWEAPVWKEATQFCNPTQYVSDDPAVNAARLAELQRILADDPTLESVSDEDEFREELAALERAIAIKA